MYNPLFYVKIKAGDSIKDKLSIIPTSPGVYIMVDKHDKIIYERQQSS